MAQNGRNPYGGKPLEILGSVTPGPGGDDGIRAGSRTDLRTLDEVVGREIPQPVAYGQQAGSGPTVREKGAGRDSNLQNHVLRTGSRACFRSCIISVKGDRRGFDQRLYAALPLSYASEIDSVEAAGLEPATRGS
jgi:hypothetical protein